MKQNYLKLVNEENKIKDAERPQELVQAPFAQKGVLVDPVVADSLEKLIKKLGFEKNIITIDAYRSKNTQESLWKNTIEEEGIDFANKFVAKPGCSEHELGLAVDLGLAEKDNDFIRPSFSNSPIVDDFLETMVDFGFILRYQKNKQHITKINYEPWHFRYVGTPHSSIIMQQDWALEEYIEFLRTTRGDIDA